jgi:hypothetical protein
VLLSRVRSSVAARLALAGAWVVALIVASTTAQPVLPALTLDSSYQVALFTAFERHLSFGTDVIWTYGPYGWLDSPFFFDLPLARLAILANVGAGTLFITLLATYLWWRQAGLAQWLVVGLILAVLVDWASYVTLDTLLSYSALILLLFAISAVPQRVRIVGAVSGGGLLGLASLIKDTELVVAVVFLGVAVGYGLILGHRSILWAPGAAVVAFLGLWLVEGARITSIPAYLRMVYEMSSGYSAAMSRANDYHLILVCAVAIIILLLIGSVAAFALREWQLAMVLVLSVAIAFVGFKESFVRYSYLSYFFTVLLVLCLIAPDVFAKRSGTRAIANAFKPGWWVVAGLAVGVVITTVPAPYLLVPRAPIAYAYRQAVWSTFYSSFAAAQHRDVIGAVQGRFPLPAPIIAKLRSGGDVDVMPTDIDVVYGYGLDWNPRPVLQSYAAYTPYLDQADALHIASSSASRYVLYYYDPQNSLDNRYPLFDEPSAFRALIENYALADASGPLLLEHRTSRVSDVSNSLGSSCVQLGEWIAVPSSDPSQFVYSRLDVPYSPAGFVRNLAYRAGELDISFRYDNGSVSPQFRLIQRVAGDGLLISAYAASQADLAHLFSGQIDHPVSAFRVASPAGSGDYTGTVCSTFIGSASPPGS